jgi:hypothetical protein
MAWTAPKTWTDGVIVTAAEFNEQIRDNQLILKTSIDDVGKFLGLSTATLADLSSTNVTGLARPTTANTFTAGRTRFVAGSAARLVVPVGADKYDGTSGNKTPGSLWIEGDYIHHVDDAKDEWRNLGTFVSTPGGGADLGSVWIEGDSVHYIDADGDEREAVSSSPQHVDVAALGGSAWVETYMHWVRESGSQEYRGHLDTHTDATTHGDVNHTDSGSAHQDAAHFDSSEPHDDVAHTDGGHADHSDHADHADGGHVDSTPHADSPHGDVAHSDHTDHADTAHVDHTDHSDVGHNDHSDHSDVAHADQPTFIGGA